MLIESGLTLISLKVHICLFTRDLCQKIHRNQNSDLDELQRIKEAANRIRLCRGLILRKMIYAFSQIRSLARKDNKE